MMATKLAVIIAVLSLMTACGNHVYHRVERGDTLYSVGWQYGYDYRQVAEWNGIRPPYTIEVGQWLRVAPPTGGAPVTERSAVAPDSAGPAPVAEVRTEGEAVILSSVPPPLAPKMIPIPPPVKATTAPMPPPPAPPAEVKPTLPVSSRAFDPATWLWPSQGTILSAFSATAPGKKGLDIGGRLGQPVLAAAPGRVVYGGSGLSGYGNMIIVKHDDNYLTAYAHNNKLYVHEGDQVAAGQRIADMGRSGAERVMLHFQIRFQGKPVDPLRYLPKMTP